MATASDPCIALHCFVIGSTTELLVASQVSYRMLSKLRVDGLWIPFRGIDVRLAKLPY